MPCIFNPGYIGPNPPCYDPDCKEVGKCNDPNCDPLPGPHAPCGGCSATPCVSCSPAPAAKQDTDIKKGNC